MAKLSQKLAGSQPYILEQLRPLERKMGLVLTLYQGAVDCAVSGRRALMRGWAASVWAILVQRQEQEDEKLAARR